MKAVRVVTDAQLELAPSIESVHRANGRRVRHALNRAIETNTLSKSDLAHETGLDGAEISRILDEDSDRHIPSRLIAAVMAKDRAHVFIAALAEMVGLEVKPKTVDLAAENKALRGKLASLRAEIDSLLDT